MAKTRKAGCHPTTPYSDLILLRRALSLDPENSSFEKIYERIKKLSKREVQDILTICIRILRNKKIAWRENERIRTSAVATLVASAPHSAQIIEELIKNKSRRGDYEIHFSLFCFLDALIDLPSTKRLRREMLSHIKGYLLNLKRDNALAGWKAGESLGWHWPLEETLPVLTEVAKEARYAAGRASALDGLGYALAYGSLAPDYRKQILSLFRDAILNDRSHVVRQTAIFVLNFQAKGRRQINALLRDVAKNNKNQEIRELAEFALENPTPVFPPKKTTYSTK